MKSRIKKILHADKFWCLGERISIRLVGSRVYGLGLAGDLSRVTDNDIKYDWTNCHVNFYLITWLLQVNFPITRRGRAKGIL